MTNDLSPTTAQVPKLPLRPFLLLGFILLLLPNILFLWGWFTPIVSIPLTILLIVSIIFLDHRICKGGGYGYGFECSKSNLTKLFLAFLFIAAFVTTSGLFGGFILDRDYLIFRNALTLNLRDAAWPVILPNGKELSYYISGLLPLAIINRLLPALGEATSIYLFIVSGIFYIYILACAYLKRVSLTFLFLGFLLTDIFTGLGVFIPQLAFHGTALTGIDLTWLTNYYYQSIYSLVLSPLKDTFGPYNSNIYTLIACGLILNLRTSQHLALPLICASLASISPIGALAIFPIALYFYYFDWKNTRNPQQFALGLIVPTLLATCVAIYFLRGDNPTTSFGQLSYHLRPQELATHLPKFALTLFLLFFPLYKLTSCNKKLLTLLFVGMVSCSMLHVGSIKMSLNELWLKGGTIYTFIVFLFLCQHWAKLGRWRVLYLSVCTLVLLSTAYQKAKTFTMSEQITDLWNGHLNHEHPFLMQSVPPTKEPLIPGIMFRTAGESEHCFPACLLPKAPGIDYTRPHQDKINELLY